VMNKYSAKKEKKPGGLKAGDKISLPRDYSQGIGIRFDETFPPDLEDVIDPQDFNDTITRINHYFAEAEKPSFYTFLEGCLGCVTFFSVFLCMESRYEKYLNQAEELIRYNNEDKFIPKGVKFIEPSKTGFMSIDILIIEDQAPVNKT